MPDNRQAPELLARMREMIGPDAPGELIPEVDPEQMKSYWAIYDRESRVAYSLEAWHLSPTSVYGKPVVYRCWMLKMLEGIPAGAVAQVDSITQDGHLIEAAVRVGARFPMRWMRLGAGTQESPYDIEAFIEEVRRADQTPKT